MTAEQTWDREAETALLSACLWSKQARIVARRTLLAADFYVPVHEALFDLMSSLDREGRPIDPVTILAAAREIQLRGAVEAVQQITVAQGIAEAAEEYARIIRGWSLRRKVAAEAHRLLQRALSPEESPERLLSEHVTALTSIRDTGNDTTAMPLGQLMEAEEEEDAPRWVIPGLMEAGDRLMLTGSEGAGKSALIRQLAICSAAGIHPFTESVMPPIRVVIVDCENKPWQVRRQTRPLMDWLRHKAPGSTDPSERVVIDTPGRISVTRDRDLSRIHQTIDTFRPDLVVMGPIYRMSDKALQTDDEATPFLAAIDTITARGCAVILEAHAGHGTSGVGKQQQRDLRPRGSSALLGWPEFGLGLRGLGGGLADLEPWRGHREQRAWPSRMRRSPGNRWLETHPDDRPTDVTQPPPGYDPRWHGPDPREPPEPQGSLDL